MFLVYSHLRCGLALPAMDREALVYEGAEVAVRWMVVGGAAVVCVVIG